MTYTHGQFLAAGVQDDVLLYIPEEAGQYEWIDGRIKEVSEPFFEHGFVCTKVTTHLEIYVNKHQLGVVISADTLFLLQEEPRIVRAPDVVFVDKSRRVPRVDGVSTVPPDLVIEVKSPSQRGKFMRRKAEDYLKGGVRLVWVIDPRKRTAVRYRNGEQPITLSEDDVLDGEDVLPGYRCPVAGLLPPLGEWYSRR
jgi:Uma2 family endonuclease